MPETLRRVAPGPARDRYLPLFFLADEEIPARAYYQTGDLFVLDDAAGAALGIVLVVPHGDGEAELKAVAVAPERQGQGVGQRLLALVLTELRAAGLRRAIVGTAGSGIGQLAFYQKAGFRLLRIERDFFSAERGYPPGLVENGIPVRDMVWMDQEL